MSGPKVVRVLTKQEKIVICQRRIDVVHDKINEWRKFASRCDALTKEDENEIESRFNYIKDMLSNEKFEEVEKYCGVEMVSLRQDMNRIRKEFVAKIERERDVKRKLRKELMEKAEKEKNFRQKLRYISETLIQTIKKSGSSIPEELQKIASSVLEVKADELSSMEKILNKLLFDHTVFSNETQVLTSLQNELLEKVSSDNKIQTFAEWKSSQGEDSYLEDGNRRLDKLMAEIEALESKETAQMFLDRIIKMEKEPLLSRRSLLIDSLIIDLINHLGAREERENVISGLREIRSELRSLTSKSARNLEVILTESIDTKNVSNSHILKERCLKLIEDETKKLASDSRRQAILSGLAKLGYEVQENMVTAWVKDGRIIVKKPNERSYGIELGTTEDTDRVQVQLVTFDQLNESSNVPRDSDRELIWCNEFNQLGVLLKESGSTIAIEKALPVGVKPLKRVKKPNKNDSGNLIDNLKQIKSE